jgi:hypothetical protein
MEGGNILDMKGYSWVGVEGYSWVGMDGDSRVGMGEAIWLGVKGENSGKFRSIDATRLGVKGESREF